MEQARWAEYRDANVRSCAVVLRKILENQETMLNILENQESMLKILRADKRFERTPYPSPPYQMLIRFLGAVGKVHSLLHREAPGTTHEALFVNTLQRHWEAIRKQFDNAIQTIDTTANPSEKQYLYSILRYATENGLLLPGL